MAMDPKRIDRVLASLEHYRRNPKRIDRVLVSLEHYWRRYPDLRLGQILGNIAQGDPYYIEDDALATELEAALGRDTPYGMPRRG